MTRKYRKLTTGLAAIATTAVAAGIAAPVFANSTLTETGSSLLYPLFQQEWIPAYQKVDPSVTLTAASTGSGTGISDAISGTVNIGASDAYLSPSQVAQTPGIENIPLAISAQTIMYNLPGIKQSTHLKLTGNILAMIYEGKITMWNAKAIQSINKGVKLPAKPIVTVRRSDSSGDTFLFTSLLSDTNATWSKTVSYGTTVSWPALPNQVGAQGNSGIVDALAATPYSISYVGISYLDSALQASSSIGEAELRNKSGNYVLPTNATISAAASVGTQNVPANETLSLIYEPGKNSYPIINFEYAIVNTKQPSATDATNVKKFLDWAIDPNGGNQSKYLSPVHFLPLPSTVEELSQLSLIHI